MSNQQAKPRGHGPLLPMPKGWEELNPTQQDWFAKNEPFAWANVQRKGECAGGRSPVELYTHHMAVRRGAFGRRKPWAERFAAERKRAIKINGEINKHRVMRELNDDPR